jgi:predicted Zn-dependent protease
VNTITQSSLGSEYQDLLRILGYVYLQHGRPERAAILYHALYALSSDDPQVAQSLACAYIRSGKPQDALPILDHLVERGEPSALTYLLRGQALASMGRMAEAARAMRFFVEARKEAASAQRAK